MTQKVTKNDARQGERRFGQEKVLIWSVVFAVIALGAVTAAVILIGPYGA